MKTPYSFFCFILLFISSVSAQDQSLKWDQSLLKGKDKDLSLLGADVSRNVFYFLSFEGKEYHLLKFDMNNQKVFDKEMHFSQLELLQNTTFNIKEALMLKDRFRILFFAINKKDSKAILFLQDISFEGEIITPASDILQSKGKERVSIHLSRSPDSSKVAYCLAIPRQKGIDKNKIKVVIYDSKMKLLTSREVGYSNNEDDDFKWVKTDNALLSNEGEIYFVGRRVGKGIKSIYSLWYLPKEGDHLASINMGSIDAKLKDCKLLMNSRDEPVLVALYTEPDAKYNSYSGYCYGKINKQSIEMRAHALSDSILHRPYHALFDQLQWNTYNRKDGGLICVFEYFWVSKKTPHFGNIGVLNVDPDGILHYSTRIYKNQAKYWGIIGSGAYFNYYSHLAEYDETQSKLTLYFNDNAENNQAANDKIKKMLVHMDNSVLVKVEIDQDGKVTKRPVAQPGDREIFFSSGVGVRLEGGELHVIGLKKDDVWLGRITNR
jgi:hypothetical protein